MPKSLRVIGCFVFSFIRGFPVRGSISTCGACASACLSVRQHTYICVRILLYVSYYDTCLRILLNSSTSAYDSVSAAYGRIRQHAAAYVSIRQHTPHTSE
jgi:hypothetical protein